MISSFFDRLFAFTDLKKNGYCRVRYETIAAGKQRGDKPVSRRAVAYSLERLEKHGYIVSQQQRWRGVQATNRYSFPELVPECKPECKTECNSEDAESQDLSAKQSADLSAMPSARCLHSQEEVVRERISEEFPLSGPPQLRAVMQGELLPAEPKRARRGSALHHDFEVPRSWRDWAAERDPRFAGMVDHEAHKFRTHWLSTGETRKNWQMCWEKWWLVALERAPRTYGLIPNSRERNIVAARQFQDLIDETERKEVTK